MLVVDPGRKKTSAQRTLTRTLLLVIITLLLVRTHPIKQRRRQTQAMRKQTVIPRRVFFARSGWVQNRFLFSEPRLLVLKRIGFLEQAMTGDDLSNFYVFHTQNNEILCERRKRQNENPLLLQKATHQCYCYC